MINLCALDLNALNKNHIFFNTKRLIYLEVLCSGMQAIMTELVKMLVDADDETISLIHGAIHKRMYAKVNKILEVPENTNIYTLTGTLAEIQAKIEELEMA